MFCKVIEQVLSMECGAECWMSLLFVTLILSEPWQSMNRVNCYYYMYARQSCKCDHNVFTAVICQQVMECTCNSRETVACEWHSWGAQWNFGDSTQQNRLGEQLLLTVKLVDETAVNAGDQFAHWNWSLTWQVVTWTACDGLVISQLIVVFSSVCSECGSWWRCNTDSDSVSLNL